MFRKAQNGWMKFAKIFGNFQMLLVLSIVYWIMMLPLALVFRLFADPLALKSPSNSHWIKRQITDNIFESMKKQG